MRKRVLILAALLLLLCACGRKKANPVCTVEAYGRMYTVDQENQTIVYDGVAYAYSVSSDGNVTFTAPGGATAYWRQSGSMGSGGWSEGWEETVWPGDLMNALKAAGCGGQGRQRSGNPLLGFLLLVVGAFNALAPQTAWDLSYGWRYKDAEPSEAALALARTGGVIAALIGMVQFFV